MGEGGHKGALNELTRDTATLMATRKTVHNKCIPVIGGSTSKEGEWAGWCDLTLYACRAVQCRPRVRRIRYPALHAGAPVNILAPINSYLQVIHKQNVSLQYTLIRVYVIHIYLP